MNARHHSSRLIPLCLRQPRARHINSNFLQFLRLRWRVSRLRHKSKLINFHLLLLAIVIILSYRYRRYLSSKRRVMWLRRGHNMTTASNLDLLRLHFLFLKLRPLSLDIWEWVIRIDLSISRCEDAPMSSLELRSGIHTSQQLIPFQALVRGVNRLSIFKIIQHLSHSCSRSQRC